ncbi:hypothetical protein [Oleidesulfovibrio sp.]|uniref:hypothetical protein n=1 Tax=Oleidesulfovibrio sp. TaxID=2909707 RepID=UPI003A8A2BC1
MTKRDILIHVLKDVTGKCPSSIGEILDFAIASNPQIAQGLMAEVPEDEAQEQIEAMKAEGPGILEYLLQGAERFKQHEGKVAQ